MQRSVWLAGILGLLLMSCGGSSGPVTAATTTTVASTPSPSSSVGDLSFEGEDVPLDAGTYTYSGVEPAFTFELGDGWRSGHLDPEFFDVHKGNASVAFAQVEWVATAAGDQVKVGSMKPEEFLDALAGDPNLQGKRVPDVKIDGHALSLLEVDPLKDGDAIFGGVEASFSPSPGPRYRVGATEVDGELVVMMPIALREPFDGAFDAANEILSTVRFQPSE
jgi:hypothetical protein